ncbi:MAG TPA: hypothetical protein VF524_01065, partial [Polyangia bacterium]
MRERILRYVGVAKRRQMCVQSSGNASGQGGLFLRKISKSCCSFTLFVDVGQTGDGGNGEQHQPE